MSTTAADAIDSLRAALAAGDDASALNIVQAWGRAVPAEALELAADVHLRAKQWREALRLLNRIIDPAPSTAPKQRLARNLVALAQHRPDIARLLDAVNVTGRFQAAMLPCGLPTLIDRGTQPPTSLSGAADPRDALARSMKMLEKPLREGVCLGLYGLGDGYLLRALAETPATLILGQTIAVHLLCDHPEQLLAAMSIHDYTGPAGPIEQKRFQWHIGPDCVEQLRRQLRADLFMPPPRFGLVQGSDGQRIEKAVIEVEREIGEIVRSLRVQVEQADARRDPAELAAVFGEHPPRRPRVMVLTTRFSTVLQHSARDAAEALESLGCDVRLMIEPDDHHRFSALTLLQAQAEFNPDALFAIDHLRYEFTGMFPENLPFICWIQDQLVNLTTRRAGESVTRRDFVLTPIPQMYRNAYGYPMRQMIELPQLTRVAPGQVTRGPFTEDLVYVSNAAPPVERMIEEALETTKNPALRQVIETACRRVVEAYSKGESLPTLWHMGRIVDAVSRDSGMTLPAEQRSLLINLLTHPLGNALYRQQALRWVIAAARETGARLSLYGAGWDKLPEFAAHARGPIGYGEPLRKLTQSARISLQILPSLCLHPRLLDGLVGGGFFLVRSHPADTVLPRLARHLLQHPAAQFTDLPADLRADAACFTELGQPIDVIEWVNSICKSGLFDEHGEALPHLDAISFHDAAGFRQRLTRFLHDDAARAEIAEAQRQSIVERLSYRSGMRRMLRAMAHLIAQESGG